MRFVRNILILILLCGMTFSCRKTPDGVIPPDEMSDLLADLHKGDAVVELRSGVYVEDSLKKALKQSILAKHGVTQADLDSSMMWYGHNLPLYVEVYDNAIAKLEDEMKETQKASAAKLQQVQIVVDGDSVNIWPGVKNRRFSSEMASNYITFNLQSDRNWEPGDSYELRSKLIDARGPATFTLAVDYTDGTSEYYTESPQGNGWQKLNLFLNSEKTASRIYGVINYVPGGKDDVAYIDSISLTRMRGQARDSIPRRRQHTFRSIR